MKFVKPMKLMLEMKNNIFGFFQGYAKLNSVRMSPRPESNTRTTNTTVMFNAVQPGVSLLVS